MEAWAAAVGRSAGLPVSFEKQLLHDRFRRSQLRLVPAQANATAVRTCHQRALPDQLGDAPASARPLQPVKLEGRLSTAVPSSSQGSDCRTLHVSQQLHVAQQLQGDLMEPDVCHTSGQAVGDAVGFYDVGSHQLTADSPPAGLWL